MVFLSATLANATEFAAWVAHLHRWPCHVVYTDFRPTPLQHYAFPLGGNGLFLVRPCLFTCTSFLSSPRFRLGRPNTRVCVGLHPYMHPGMDAGLPRFFMVRRRLKML